MSRISNIRSRLQGMTAKEIAGESLLRVSRLAYRAVRRAADNLGATFITDDDLRRALGGVDLADVAARLRERREPRLLPGLGDLPQTANLIRQFYPDSVEAAREQADEICRHRIRVFGQAIDFGPQLDWRRDPHTGARWPLTHYTKVPLRLGSGADVRQVWELNRLQHLAALGRAYALTDDENYASEFLLQLASWVEANPPRFGVNWTVAMEAALRAVNLIAAFELFLASPQMTDEAIALMLKLMLAHGRFIRANLEYSHRTPSNHYLADLIGLFSIGMTMPDLSESRGWIRFSAPRLLNEMERQVHADGVSYEGSVAYHRLVTEVFALFFSLSVAGGVELPGESWERLEAMFAFVRAYLKPDGSAPMIGDADDGRLLSFKAREPADHSYLLSIAAVLLENEAFKPSSRIDEEAIWWFGQAGLEAFDSLPVSDQPSTSEAFADAQIFIERADDLYAIIDCGDHGAGGRGSHAHSDALSLELYAYGATFLRDPGSYVYTASARWRNLFRSTAYHNAVRIDGKEISRFDEDALFAFIENVRPQINQWQSDATSDLLDAEHYAYTRLAQPVTHRRIVTFNKGEGYWTIKDQFTGEGAHQFEFFFNFDAGLDAALSDDQRVTVRSDKAVLAIIPLSQQVFEIKRTDRWVSPAYATRLRASGIIYRLYANAPFENVFLLAPYKLGEEGKVDRIKDTGFGIQG
ncbi:MAG: alginate lyase family protein [Blastocatellia bacterium]